MNPDRGPIAETRCATGRKHSGVLANIVYSSLLREESLEEAAAQTRADRRRNQAGARTVNSGSAETPQGDWTLMTETQIDYFRKEQKNIWTQEQRER